MQVRRWISMFMAVFDDSVDDYSKAEALSLRFSGD